jgi:hypothetical protein
MQQIRAHFTLASNFLYHYNHIHAPPPPPKKASVPVGRQGCDGGGRLGRKGPGQAVQNDDDDTECLEHQQVVAEPHQVIHNTYSRQSN